MTGDIGCKSCRKSFRKSCPLKRRFLLIFSLGPFLLIYPGEPWMFHWGFVVPIVSLAVWVWLFNFDKVVEALHQKPIYFEDLQMPAPSPNRARFQKIFIRLLGVCIALLVGLTVDFQITSWKNESYDWYAVIGIIGGIWTIVDKFEGYISHALLTCINYARVNSPQVKATLELDSIHLEIPTLQLDSFYDTHV